MKFSRTMKQSWLGTIIYSLLVLFGLAIISYFGLWINENNKIRNIKNELEKNYGKNLLQAIVESGSGAWPIISFVIIIVILVALISSQSFQPVNSIPTISNPTVSNSTLGQSQICNVARTGISPLITIEGPGARESCNELINKNPGIGLYLAAFNDSYQRIECSIKLESLTFTIRDFNSSGSEGSYLCNEIINIKNGIYPLLATPTLMPTFHLIIYYAIVNVDYANIRVGPGANFSIIASATRGQKLLILSYPPFGDWIQVSQSVMYAGWIYTPAVQITIEQLK
jgi:hypothetical protein